MNAPPGGSRRPGIALLRRVANVIAHPELIRTIGTGLNRAFVRDLLKLRDDIGFVPATIVDAGASTGAWSRAAMHVYPDAALWAFEPVPSSFAALARLKAGHPRFSCFPYALGSSNGATTLYQNAFPDSSSTLPMTPRLAEVYPHASHATEIAVEQRRLDAVTDVTMEAPALLKLDVQGAELQVLLGSGDLLDRTGVIIAEITFEELYSGQATYDELCTFLRRRGFDRFFQLRPESPERDRLQWADLAFLRSEHAMGGYGGKGR